MSGWRYTTVCAACLKEARDCQCDKYCSECGIITNHTSAQHLEAERQQAEDLALDAEDREIDKES